MQNIWELFFIVSMAVTFVGSNLEMKCEFTLIIGIAKAQFLGGTDNRHLQCVSNFLMFYISLLPLISKTTV